MLSSIIDCLPFELIVVDLQSNVIKQNRVARNIWGDYTNKNILSAPLSSQGIENWKKNLEHIKKNKIRDYEEEVRIKGKTLHLHRIVAPFLYNETIIGVISLSIDITEKVKLQKLVVQNANFLNSILNTIPTEVWVIDGDDCIQLQSKYAQKKWGNLRGKDINEFTCSVNYSIDITKFPTEVRKGNIIDIEYAIDDHGEKRHIRRLMAPVLDVNGKTGYTSISFDITELKNTVIELNKHKENLEMLVQERTHEIEQLNEELQASIEELHTTNEELFVKNELIEKKNIELGDALKDLRETQIQMLQVEKMASLGVLTAGVAHEINNPLNYLMGSFIGLTDYFEKFESSDNENTDVLLNSIQVGIERISTIVKGLNQFSRNVDSLDEACDIPSIIENCLVMLHNEIKHKVEIIKEYSNEHIVVKGNIGKLHQVFLNLITNAIHAILNKGTIWIKINISGNNVEVEIVDDGIGIDEQAILKITDPFYTTKPPGKGTGLGLFISKSIIIEHMGTLAFKSVVNQGTTAIITLPLKME